VLCRKGRFYKGKGRVKLPKKKKKKNPHKNQNKKKSRGKISLKDLKKRGGEKERREGVIGGGKGIWKQVTLGYENELIFHSFQHMPNRGSIHRKGKDGSPPEGEREGRLKTRLSVLFRGENK